jgi:hypothetical protein
MSGTGQITQLNNPPISLYDGSGWNGTLTVDPVSGTYLILTPTTREFYTYDVLTDTWQAQNCPSKPSMSQGVAATPIAKYGVTFFVNCGSTTCHAYLYKHNVTAVESGASAAAAGEALTVSPNPFRSTVKIDVNLRDASLAVYTINGKLIKNFTESSTTWDASGLPGGIYLLKARSNEKTFITKLFLQK